MKHLILLCITFLFAACDSKQVISVAVSDDGQYAVSVNDDKSNSNPPKGGTLILWDIANKKKQILSEQVNIYSVAFVPDSHDFIWQDDNDIVHLQNVDGKEIRQFKNFTTEGQLIDENGLYLAANDRWHIYSGYGDEQRKVLYNSNYGGDKPLNISFGGQYFVSAGIANGEDIDKKTFLTPIVSDGRMGEDVPYAGVTLWDKKTLQPLTKLIGNRAKTFARISPDGKWVVSGDENGGRYMWSTQPPYKRQTLIDSGGPIHSISFLDNGQYFLEFYHRWESDITDASLYRTGDPHLVKEFSLWEECTKYYQRNTCIASAPKANIVVAGQEDGGGINVYRFDPQALTLDLIWQAR